MPETSPETLSEAWSSALADFEHHLGAERNLSAHSVRAYLTDLTRLAEHATKLGIDDPATLTLRSLRSHLATQQTLGRARTTLARRATSTRVFTAWLNRTGRAHTDAGALLASPKSHRELPVVLGHDDIRALIDATTAAIADDGPIGLRDLALIELLYATGIRVGELCGLDIDDLDRERRVVTGARQGSQGASRAVRRAGRRRADAAGSTADGPRSSRRRPARRCSSVPGAAGSTSAWRAASCTSGSPPSTEGPTSGRTGCATPPPPTCSKAVPTSAACRRSSATPRSAPRRSTRT